MLPILPLIALGSVVYAAGNNFYKTYSNKKQTDIIETKLQETNTKSIKKTDSLNSTKHTVEKNLVYSAGVLTLTTLGITTLPLFTLVAIPIELYLFLPFIERGYKQIIERKKIGVDTVDMVISLMLIAGGFFFASALFFIIYNISQTLLLKTQQTSQKSIINILGERNNRVWLFDNGNEIEISADQIKEGDIIIAQAGEMIAVDGIITLGIASIDQHILTGESQAVEKTIADHVFAGTVILSGKVFIQVEKAGKATVAEQIGIILNDTIDFKFNLQTKGEYYADKSAVPTLLIAGITLPILGYASATTVLLAALGYNMRIIAPISVLNALKATSKRGVLVKDGRALESLVNIDTVVFDKTGTLTQEQPHIGRIYTISDEYNENEVLTFAACAEYRQTHPIARAIMQAAQQRQLPLTNIEHAHYQVGYGLKVKLLEKTICVGSLRFMQMENIEVSSTMQTLQADCQMQGYSFVYVALNEQLIGAIELQPTLRPCIKDVVAKLHHFNIKTYIISGDNQIPTQQLAQQLGIDDYFAEVSPTDKAKLITQLQTQGKKVCFIGDGINDAIALKQADVSISLHGASTIATDTAQIVLMNSDLTHIPWLFEFAFKLNTNLQRSLKLSVIPGVVCIGGVYLLGFNIITGTILYNIGLALGVSNAMLLRDSAAKDN
jgi:Cu2+-exporting ATPase